MRVMGEHLVLYGLRTDGDEFPIDASISQIDHEGGKLFTVILRDITARKEAQAALERSYRELRELSAAMHEVREAERTRIARELHDELAQWLTALKMDVAWLSSRLPEEPRQLIDRTEKMKGLVDTTVGAVRRIAAALRPVMLDDLGLLAATENLLHDFSQRTGTVVSHELGAWADDLGEPLSTSLYRILQEAVTNVARHAAATELRVTLSRENGDLVLRVRDNGRGFDTEAAANGKSFGVLGMRERAHTLGGRARFERLATGGTLVEIVIPYERYETREPGAGRDSRAAG
jgi:two-component system sensor kinase